MCSKLQSSAQTGMVTISTANPNLNGTGALGTVFTAPASAHGVSINSITIKATGSTTEGMVRIFITDINQTSLYREINVPAVVQTAYVSAFQFTIDNPIILNAGDSIQASTQNAENFNVIANATAWTNCECGDGCCDETLVFANTGVVNIAAANSNLDGTGNLGTVITAGSQANAAGTLINTVNIKATRSTGEGMVRLFVGNGGGTQFLLTEIPIPASVQSGVEPAFRTECPLGFYLQPGYSLYASTEIADSFNIITHSNDLVNCPCS